MEQCVRTPLGQNNNFGHKNGEGEEKKSEQNENHLIKLRQRTKPTLVERGRMRNFLRHLIHKLEVF